jgi:serine protease Do
MSSPVSQPARRQNARRRVRTLALTGTLLASSIGASLAIVPFVQAGVVPSIQSQTAQSAATSQNFSPLVKRVMPAVVNISVTQNPGPASVERNDAAPDRMPSPYDEFLRRFFERQSNDGSGMGEPDARPHNSTQSVALGSGFIIDPSGYIVTNNHVVANADKITVIFQDDTRHPAKIIGRDEKTDLALLKIEAKNPLPYVGWGDSSALEVGDWVVAVGNPFGLGGTVSKGIVSARGRDIHSGPYDDFIQIDASINRGNSGGPTFGLDGRVVGINTAIYSPNGGSVGIGFAIPASITKPVIDQLRNHGTVERSWIGVQIQPVTPEIAESLGMSKPQGALVADISEDGPAARAGLKQGDVILSFNGHEIGKPHDLSLTVAATPAGHAAPVKVWREKKEVDLETTMTAMPKGDQVAANDAQPKTPATATALGLALSALTDELRQQLGVSPKVHGVAVTAVADKSPAPDLGIKVGDIIESINQQPVASPQQAADLLRDLKSGRAASALVLMNRHGVNQYVALSGENRANNDNGG